MSTQKNLCFLNEKGEPVISVWWSNGTMCYVRDYLPSTHPESTYACLEQLGKEPLDYGIRPTPPQPEPFPPLIHDSL